MDEYLIIDGIGSFSKKFMQKINKDEWMELMSLNKADLNKASNAWESFVGPVPLPTRPTNYTKKKKEDIKTDENVPESNG